MPTRETMTVEQGKRPVKLKFLTPHEIAFIDDLLASVGEYGEIRLEVKNGRLRFASRTESIDPLKYEESS